MDYHFEALGDERFQKLCQALLVAQFPKVICYPVGMPDGGRDAALAGASGKKVVVFQVKFVRDPSTRESRDAVVEAIRTEAEKVQRLKDRGASEYYLITNVQGTSHLDVGSMDRADQVLSDELGIDAHIWWREDLTARLNHHSQIKWNFVELLKGGDILSMLVSSASKAEEDARRAIDSYISLQSVRDSQLKFKQIDLEKGLLHLFSDVPVDFKSGAVIEAAAQGALTAEKLSEYGVALHVEYDHDLRRRTIVVGAMQLFSKGRFCEENSLILLEGAPGQGKSTVTQYLCQVHRLAILGKEEELKLVPTDFMPDDVRIPFRIDLRDYAAWISGRNPFAESYSEPLPSGTSPVLEKFMSAQVSRATGADFSVEDLRWISSKSKILVVLDGFDEVAEPSIRARIITEVGDAAVRLQRGSLSVQMVVTSRPTAFANSPGFPRSTWAYMDLLPLARAHVDAYAERWLAAKGLDPRERRELKRALDDAVAHVHVRDLARNPMQLSILLALMNVQGVSLPNKRTSLYDKYMDIFFNRETDKSDVIRDNRDLILQLHGYVAWTLQIDAENNGSGNLSADALRTLVRGYLERHGHKTDLLDELLTGVTERVVALVSRVSGTYEFEVQPLREYFAARHIYDSAPYVVAAMDEGGTKPDRFRALSKNFFWRNVVRFYAGCYTTGELASIVEGLAELEEDQQTRETVYSVRLACELLTDYVFAGKPKLAERVLEPLVIREALIVFASVISSGMSSKRYALPAGPGQRRLQDIIRAEVLRGPPHSHRTGLLSLFSMNSDNDDKRRLIADEASGRSGAVSSTVLIALAATVFESVAYLASVEVDNELALVRALFADGRYEAFEARSGSLGSMREVVAWDPYAVTSRYESLPESEEVLRFIRVSSVFANYRIHSHWDGMEDETFGQSLMPILTGDELRSEYERKIKSLPTVDSNGTDWSEFDAILGGLDALHMGGIGSAMESLRRLVDIGVDYLGDCFSIRKFAFSIAYYIGPSDRPIHSILDGSLNLMDRFQVAYTEYDSSLWSELVALVVAQSRDGEVCGVSLVAILHSAPMDVVLAEVEPLSLVLSKLSHLEYQSLVSMVEDREPDDAYMSRETFESSLLRCSPRLAHALKARFSTENYDAVWAVVLRDAVCTDSIVATDTISYGIYQANEDPSEWPRVIASAKRNMKSATGFLFIPDELVSSAGIPVELASSVAADPLSYPPLVVALCVARLDAVLGQKSVPVSTRALEQRWPD